MLDKLNNLLALLWMNLTAILFLLGIIIIDYAIFNYISALHGYIAIGVSMMFVAWLLNHESDEGKR